MSDIATTPWKRVVTPGTVGIFDGRQDRQLQVFVEIEYRFERNQKWELSICGTEGPKANGDAWGGSGQIDLQIDDLNPGWDAEMVARLGEIWGRWHLNGMRAGSPAQEAWLRAHPVKVVYPESHYKKAKEALSRAGLQPDGSVDPPYSYGSAWLYEEVPTEVLEWLYGLPEAAWPHPWGDTDRRIECRS